jgi:DNA-binding response OmpR family regulator
MVIERILNKAGYDMIHAADGDMALSMAREQHPDLILLDLMLPKVSGHDVLKTLKQDAATQKIPVIILSGLSQNNEIKLRKDGAALYFEKSQLLDSKSGGDKFLEAIRACIAPPNAKAARST